MKYTPLILLLLFSSCVSYNTVNLTNLNYQVLQNIEVIKFDKTSVKGQLVSTNKIELTLFKNGVNQTILKKEINEVRVKNFSAGKTAILGLSLLTGIIVILPPFPALL